MQQVISLGQNIASLQIVKKIRVLSIFKAEAAAANANRKLRLGGEGDVSIYDVLRERGDGFLQGL